MANTLFILLTNDNLIQALTDADVAKIAKLIKIENVWKIRKNEKEREKQTKKCNQIFVLIYWITELFVLSLKPL